MIPYSRQLVEDDDIAAVVEVLRSDYLTQGPRIMEFEDKLAHYCGAKYAVVVANGTAALHTAYYAAGLQTDDEIISSSITFPATTNAALWQGAKPVFVDVEENTGNIDANLIEEKITAKTKAIVPIDYTGRPANLDKIIAIAKKHNLIVVEDACQALGASYSGKKIGSISDLTVFSFHPVKSITTGEGGAILTNNEEYYKKMKRFVTHGVIKKDFINESPGEWYFEMQILGMNYRLTDLQCALGISQLKKVDRFVERRQEIVNKYHQAFADNKNIDLPPLDTVDAKSAWHLYVIKLNGDLVDKRSEVFKRLKNFGIDVNVHHIPVYYHPYYEQLGYRRGICPKAEKYYEMIVSLPIYPGLTEEQQDFVIKSIIKVLS